MHIHSGDLMVPVCGVIVNSPVCITAGGVDGDFILSAAHIAATSLLLYGMQDMKELAHAFCLRISGDGISPHKGSPDKTGRGGKISRQSHGSHAAAVSRKFQSRHKAVLRLSRRQTAVII